MKGCMNNGYIVSRAGEPVKGRAVFKVYRPDGTSITFQAPSHFGDKKALAKAKRLGL